MVSLGDRSNFGRGDILRGLAKEPERLGETLAALIGVSRVLRATQVLLRLRMMMSSVLGLQPRHAKDLTLYTTTSPG